VKLVYRSAHPLLHDYRSHLLNQTGSISEYELHKQTRRQCKDRRCSLPAAAPSRPQPPGAGSELGSPGNSAWPALDAAAGWTGR
jgi:hypothetical protein